MPHDKELMGASTSLLLLALLSDEPSYGYQLVKRLAAQSNKLFDWQEGTVYPVLHRLANEGLIRAQWQDADASGSRRRKYYYITAKGRRALADRAAQWNAFHSLIARVTKPLLRPEAQSNIADRSRAGLAHLQPRSFL